MARARIVVIGGGFAGLGAVRGLRHLAGDIVLIDQHNHHTFQPLLYQVATAGLAAPSIAAPLRHILRRQRNVTVRLGAVQRIEPAAHTVLVDGEQLPYDYLLIATGVSHAYFGHDDWAANAPGLKTLDDALRIRARILTAFERAESSTGPQETRALLTFVIVGGGPTGVELAGTLAEIARHTLRGEFRRINPADARVVLVEAGPRVLPAFAADLSASAQRQLETLGVTVRTGVPITLVDDTGVRIGEEPLAARTVLWAAGVTGSSLAISPQSLHRQVRCPALRPPPSRWADMWRASSRPGWKAASHRPSSIATWACLPPSGAWPPWWTWVGCASRACWPGGSGCWRMCIS
jgi:NADH dehydrogenase